MVGLLPAILIFHFSSGISVFVCRLVWPLPLGITNASSIFMKSLRSSNFVRTVRADS